MTGIDHTHDPAACSWVPDADAYADFPVQNLPLGVFSGGGGTPRIGVDIGDWCVDLEALAPRLPEEARAALAEPALNAVFARPQLLIARPDGIFDVLRQKVHIEGIELNLAVQMPIKGLKLSTGYAHLSGRYDSIGDDVIDTDLDGANISPDRLNLAASYVRGPISARVQTQFYF